MENSKFVEQEADNNLKASEAEVANKNQPENLVDAQLNTKLDTLQSFVSSVWQQSPLSDFNPES